MCAAHACTDGTRLPITNSPVLAQTSKYHVWAWENDTLCAYKDDQLQPISSDKHYRRWVACGHACLHAPHFALLAMVLDILACCMQAALERCASLRCSTHCFNIQHGPLRQALGV